jgi:hypothetical protein
MLASLLISFIVLLKGIPLLPLLPFVLVDFLVALSFLSPFLSSPSLVTLFSQAITTTIIFRFFPLIFFFFCSSKQGKVSATAVARVRDQRRLDSLVFFKFLFFTSFIRECRIAVQAGMHTESSFTFKKGRDAS